MGLHPVMGRLGELGGCASELRGRGGYRERLVLLGGKGGLCVLVGLERVLPALLGGIELLGGRRVLRLRILCVLVGLERGLEGGALLLERGRCLFQIVAGGSGGVGGSVELGTGAAERRVIKRRIDVEQGIAGLHRIVGPHIDADHRAADLRGHADDVRSGIGVLGGRVELDVAPIVEGAGYGRDNDGGKRHPAKGGKAGRALANLGRSVLIHLFYLGRGGGMDRPGLASRPAIKGEERQNDGGGLDRLDAARKVSVTGQGLAGGLGHKAALPYRRFGFTLTGQLTGAHRKLGHRLAWRPSSIIDVSLVRCGQARRPSGGRSFARVRTCKGRDEA